MWVYLNYTKRIAFRVDVINNFLIKWDRKLTFNLGIIKKIIRCGIENISGGIKSK